MKTSVYKKMMEEENLTEDVKTKILQTVLREYENVYDKEDQIKEEVAYLVIKRTKKNKKWGLAIVSTLVAVAFIVCVISLWKRNNQQNIPVISETPIPTVIPTTEPTLTPTPDNRVLDAKLQIPDLQDKINQIGSSYEMQPSIKVIDNSQYFCLEKGGVSVCYKNSYNEYNDQYQIILDNGIEKKEFKYEYNLESLFDSGLELLKEDILYYKDMVPVWYDRESGHSFFGYHLYKMQDLEEWDYVELYNAVKDAFVYKIEELDNNKLEVTINSSKFIFDKSTLGINGVTDLEFWFSDNIMYEDGYYVMNVGISHQNYFGRIFLVYAVDGNTISITGINYDELVQLAESGSCDYELPKVEYDQKILAYVYDVNGNLNQIKYRVAEYIDDTQEEKMKEYGLDKDDFPPYGYLLYETSAKDETIKYSPDGKCKPMIRWVFPYITSLQSWGKSFNSELFKTGGEKIPVNFYIKDGVVVQLEQIYIS